MKQKKKNKKNKNKNKTILKVGTTLGRYTDIELVFEQIGDKVFVKSGQGVNLSQLFADLFDNLHRDQD